MKKIVWVPVIVVSDERSGLVRIRLHYMCRWYKHCTDVVGARFDVGWYIDINDWGENRNLLCRAQFFCLLILVAERSSQTFWEML